MSKFVFQPYIPFALLCDNQRQPAFDGKELEPHAIGQVVSILAIFKIAPWLQIVHLGYSASPFTMIFLWAQLPRCPTNILHSVTECLNFAESH